MGRLLDHKQVDLAVQAVPLLLDQGVPVHLTVIGEGPLGDGTGRPWPRGWGCRTTSAFLPFFADHEQVLERLAEADVLLFPSAREGFGMVALEAMSVGTPVVTSDHPDNFARHLVVEGRNGSVRASTAGDMAEGVRAVLDQLSALSANARETAREYDWDHLAGKGRRRVSRPLNPLVTAV